MIASFVQRTASLAALASALSAGPAAAETLADAIRAAYNANPELLAARSEARAADATLDRARAAYGPSVSANASYSYTYQRADLPTGGKFTLDGFAPSYSITGTQPLFTSGRLSAGVSGARASVGLGREQLRQTEQGVLGDVINAYVSVRRDLELVAIATENADLLGRQRSDTDARLRVRETTATDYQQTENRFALAQAQLAEAQGQLQASRAAYTAVVGHPPGVLEPEPDLPGLPIAVDQAYELAEANSPTLLAAEYRELQSRAALAAARSQRGPTISLDGSASRNSQSPFNNQFRADQVIGRVTGSLPLFTSGAISASIREARATNDRDWRLVDQARRDVRQQVASSWERLQAVRASLPPYERAVKAAEDAFAGAKEQERVGARATIEVLDQARDLLQSRTAFVSARANEYLLRASLLAATGRLEAPIIVPGTPAYNPVRKPALAGIPLVSPALRAVDSVVDGDLATPRPTRDDAVRMHPGPALPPGPVPPATPVPAVAAPGTR